jgi:hypothetical protein
MVGTTVWLFDVLDASVDWYVVPFVARGARVGDQGMEQGSCYSSPNNVRRLAVCSAAPAHFADLCGASDV